MRIFLIIILLFACVPAAVCESADISDALIEYADIVPLQRAAGDSLSVRDTVMGLMTGELRFDEVIIDTLSDIKDTVLERTLGVFAAFFVPMMIVAVVNNIAGGGSRSIDILLSCVCAASFLSVIMSCMHAAETLATRVADITDAAFPALSGLLSVSGSETAAAMLTPMAALSGKITVDIVAGIGIKLCSIAGLFACCGALGGPMKLDGMFDLVRYAINWGSGLLLAFFVGVLSVQGLLSGGYDSAAFRTARFAFDKMVPIIGRGISDSLSTVLSSVSLVKNAVGVTGVIAIGAACLDPIITLWSAYFAIRLASAAAQSVCDSGIIKAADRFARVISMLLMLSLVCITISVITLGAAMTAGRNLVVGR